MMNSILKTAAFAIFIASGIGGATTSNQEQRNALTHQKKSDEAASNGQYGVAGDEQLAAQEAHHKAVKKAISEGKPLPPQPKAGDAPPPAATP